MRISSVTRMAFIASSSLTVARPCAAFTIRAAPMMSTQNILLSTIFSTAATRPRLDTTRLFFSFSESPAMKEISKDDMADILEDYEEGGREDSGYIVLDVRNAPEVAATGPLSPHTQTLPLPAIIDGCFRLDEQEFKTAFGFDKPTMDETLVFSCAAGIRATRAAEIALGVGYTKVVVYKGGANEWFA